MAVKNLADLLAEGVEGRGVLVRCDLNVPLDDAGNVTDTGRIDASVPTLKALADAGAKVVVTAHLGRPKNGPDPKFSLAPVAKVLGEKLGRHVQLAGDVVGTDALARAEGLTDGDVLLLRSDGAERWVMRFREVLVLGLLLGACSRHPTSERTPDAAAHSSARIRCSPCETSGCHRCGPAGRPSNWPASAIDPGTPRAPRYSTSKSSENAAARFFA